MAQQEKFKGFDIVIDNNDKLTIDGKPIEVFKSEDSKYSTNYLPYTQYGDILDMAKQVIDKAPDFDTLSKQP